MPRVGYASKMAGVVDDHVLTALFRARPLFINNTNTIHVLGSTKL